MVTDEMLSCPAIVCKRLDFKSAEPVKERSICTENTRPRVVASRIPDARRDPGDPR